MKTMLNIIGSGHTCGERCTELAKGLELEMVALCLFSQLLPDLLRISSIFCIHFIFPFFVVFFLWTCMFVCWALLGGTLAINMIAECRDHRVKSKENHSAKCRTCTHSYLQNVTFLNKNIPAFWKLLNLLTKTVEIISNVFGDRSWIIKGVRWPNGRRALWGEWWQGGKGICQVDDRETAVLVGEQVTCTFCTRLPHRLHEAIFTEFWHTWNH